MKVSVQVRIWNPINQDHIDMMKFCARSMCCDAESELVTVEVDEDCLVANFRMRKEREMDAADRIIDKFMCFVPDSNDCTIWFPKPKRLRKSRSKSLRKQDDQ